MDFHANEQERHRNELNLADKVAAFADEYWPAFVITFGAFFIFTITFHYNIR